MNVTIYSTSTCTWCKKTKEWFKEHDVKYAEVNITEHPEKAEEVVKLSGQTGVPVIDVDGEIIIGFDEDALKKALKIK